MAKAVSSPTKASTVASLSIPHVSSPPIAPPELEAPGFTEARDSYGNLIMNVLDTLEVSEPPPPPAQEPSLPALELKASTV